MGIVHIIKAIEFNRLTGTSKKLRHLFIYVEILNRINGTFVINHGCYWIKCGPWNVKKKNCAY